MDGAVLGVASAVRRAGSGGGTDRNAAQGFGLSACAIGFLCSSPHAPHTRTQREAEGESEWTGVLGC